MAAKYDPELDQNLPFLFGKRSHHFHRWIKAVWHLIPIREGEDYKEIERRSLDRKKQIDTNILARKFSRQNLSLRQNISSSSSRRNVIESGCPSDSSIRKNKTNTVSSTSSSSREVRNLITWN